MVVLERHGDYGAVGAGGGVGHRLCPVGLHGHGVSVLVAGIITIIVVEQRCGRDDAISILISADGAGGRLQVVALEHGDARVT